jgi:hypothetical protein
MRSYQLAISPTPWSSPVVPITAQAGLLMPAPPSLLDRVELAKRRKRLANLYALSLDQV